MRGSYPSDRVHRTVPPNQNRKLPSGREWLHEIKHDGLGKISRIVFPRSSRHWPACVRGPASLCGEAVSCDDNGIALASDTVCEPRSWQALESRRWAKSPLLNTQSSPKTTAPAAAKGQSKAKTRQSAMSTVVDAKARCDAQCAVLLSNANGLTYALNSEDVAGQWSARSPRFSPWPAVRFDFDLDQIPRQASIGSPDEKSLSGRGLAAGVWRTLFVC